MFLATQKPYSESCCKGITRPDSIADNGRYTRLINDFRCRDQNRSLCTAGHNDKIQPEAGQQDSQCRFWCFTRDDVAGGEDLAHLIITEFQYTRQGNRLTEERVIKERPSQVHIKHPENAAPPCRS